MKNSIAIFIWVFIFSTAFGQDLSITVVGSDAAYCRTAGYQSGNGVVYVAVSGGVTPYTYLWTNLMTGTTNTNATWGGLNPGCYLIEVTDAVGDEISSSTCVDSLNPVANMAVISDDVLGGPFFFTGEAPAAVSFDNLSLNVPDMVGPEFTVRYYFKPQGLATPETATSLTTDFYYTYEFGGVWTASLVAKNINGCTDTLYLTFSIDGPNEITEVQFTESFTVSPNANSGQLNILSPQDTKPFTLRIYDVAGNLVVSKVLIHAETVLDYNFPTGIYYYEVLDNQNDQRLQTGKFAY